jgi:predicted anti-sigma-YlaC factor YlaD
MKCGDFLEALREEDSFVECVRHYKQCPDCRERHKSDFELEAVLRDIKQGCRSVDLSSSVKSEIRIRQIRRRELSAARLTTWVMIGLAVVYFIILVVPIFDNWPNIIREGFQSAESNLGSLIIVKDFGVKEMFDKIVSVGFRKELIGFMIVICVLSLAVLVIQSKEYLIKLRLMLNR